MRKLLPIIIIVVLSSGAFFLLNRQGKRVSRPAGPVVIASFLTADFGNATVFKMPDGRALVIDPGAPNTADALVEYLRYNDISSIDVLITRGNGTILETLRRLFEAFEVRRVIHTGTPWAESIHGPGGSIAEVLLFGGDSFRLGGELRLTALSPPRDAVDADERPLITRLQYRRSRFLLMSDAGIEDEGYLIRSGQDVSTDILVIGRNGRYSTTSLELIVAAKPKYFVLLVNRGHKKPGRSILERIDANNTGARVYRTDNDGIVKMVTDGRSISVEPQ